MPEGPIEAFSGKLAGANFYCLLCLPSLHPASPNWQAPGLTLPINLLIIDLPSVSLKAYPTHFFAQTSIHPPKLLPIPPQHTTGAPRGCQSGTLPPAPSGWHQSVPKVVLRGLLPPTSAHATVAASLHGQLGEGPTWPNSVLITVLAQPLQKGTYPILGTPLKHLPLVIREDCAIGPHRTPA